MILTINLDKEKLQESIEVLFTSFLRYIYSWLSEDGEVIGYIIGIYHMLIAVCIPLLAFVSHTIYPNIWLKLYTFLCLFFIFAQHLIFNACLLIPMEERLTKQKTIFYPLMEAVLQPLKITVEQFIAYLVLAEGFTTLCFGLEITSEISRFIYKRYGIDI